MSSARREPKIDSIDGAIQNLSLEGSETSSSSARIVCKDERDRSGGRNATIMIVGRHIVIDLGDAKIFEHVVDRRENLL